METILQTTKGQLFGRFFLVKLFLLLLMPLVLMTGCTRYQPLGHGAKVPWAEALLAGKAGPLARNRYRVGDGDALSVIAERYRLPLPVLAAANNIEAPYILYPGEVLRIPRTSATDDRSQPSTEQQSAQQPEEVVQAPREERPTITQTALPDQWQNPSVTGTQPRWEPRSRPQRQTDRPASPPQERSRRYVVKPGDSLSRIAVDNGLSLGELAAANGLEPPFRLRPGQPLIIPPTENQRRQANASPPLDASLAPPPPLSQEGFLWPVQGEVIGTFQENSAKGRSGGINIAARLGTPVIAAENGIVAYAGEALRGYGRMILIRHADGYVTLYAHNAVLLVGEGEFVERGQNIAEVGSSGDVVESQLHFELRKGSEPIDPSRVLAGLPGRQFGQLRNY